MAVNSLFLFRALIALALRLQGIALSSRELADIIWRTNAEVVGDYSDLVFVVGTGCSGSSAVGDFLHDQQRRNKVEHELKGFSLDGVGCKCRRGFRKFALRFVFGLDFRSPYPATRAWIRQIDEDTLFRRLEAASSLSSRADFVRFFLKDNCTSYLILDNAIFYNVDRFCEVVPGARWILVLRNLQDQYLCHKMHCKELGLVPKDQDSFAVEVWQKEAQFRIIPQVHARIVTFEEFVLNDAVRRDIFRFAFQVNEEVLPSIRTGPRFDPIASKQNILNWPT